MTTSKVNDNGGNRIVVGLTPARWDRVEVTHPSSTVDVYTFYYAGSIQGVVTLTYDGSDELVSAERTA